MMELLLKMKHSYECLRGLTAAALTVRHLSYITTACQQCMVENAPGLLMVW
jgi:hypothetical protein